MGRIKELLFGTALLIVALFTPLVPAQLAVAEDLNSEVCNSVPAGQEKPIVCRDTADSSNPIFGPEGILTKAVQALIYVIAAVSVIVIIVGGIRYIVSAGDSNATKGAKDSILYAVVGLVVAMFAQALVAFVLSQL